MEKLKIFRKVKPDENKLELDRDYFGLVYGEEIHSLQWRLHGDRDEYADFFIRDDEKVFFDEVDWILEEVTINTVIQPTRRGKIPTSEYSEGFIEGANYILNLLK